MPHSSIARWHPTVQPKLTNFMFPEIPERPVVLSELFASVFGQRIAAGGVSAADMGGGAAAAAGARRLTGSKAARRKAAAADASGELNVPLASLFG